MHSESSRTSITREMHVAVPDSDVLRCAVRGRLVVEAAGVAGVGEAVDPLGQRRRGLGRSASRIRDSDRPDRPM